MSSYLKITQTEVETLKRRAEEAAARVASADSVTEGLIAYAIDNGFTPEKAHRLVEEKVIPRVDEYNSTCRACVEDGQSGRILGMISARAEDMTLEEECKYKLGVLTALRASAREMLSRIAALGDEDQELAFDELTDEDIRVLDNDVYTEESLAQINEMLAEALENSGIELEMMDRLEELLDSAVSEDDVHGFVTEMWQDERYKYVLAVAACVAKENGELPSVPEGIGYDALIIGMCQGVDIANVQQRVSAGEMTADGAYKVIKAVASAGVAILAAAFIFAGGLVLAGAASGVIAEALGSGMIACVIGAAIGAVLFFALEFDFFEMVGAVTDTFRKVTDFTYQKLKQGVKAIAKVARERVIPKVRTMIETVGSFVRSVADRVRSALRRGVPIEST